MDVSAGHARRRSPARLIRRAIDSMVLDPRGNAIGVLNGGPSISDMRISASLSCLLFAEPSFSSDEQRDVRGWPATGLGWLNSNR